MLLFDERYLGVLGRVLSGARERIYIAQFRIDRNGVCGSGVVSRLLSEVVKRRQAGVEVKVLLDLIFPLRGRAANNMIVARWFKERNIGVRFMARNRCQHSKLVLIDGQHALFGSHNLTSNSLLRNSEISYYLTDVVEVSELEQEFSKHYNDGKDFTPSLLR